MNNKNLIIGAALLGGGIILWRSYQNASELANSLVFAPESIDLDTTYIFAPKLKITVQITNPSPNEVMLSKIFATVKLDGSQIGTINNENLVKIAGTATTRITLNITLNSIELLTKLISLDVKNLGNTNITIEGYYVANLIRLPLVLQFGKKIGAKRRSVQLLPYDGKWIASSNYRVKKKILEIYFNGVKTKDVINQINLSVSDHKSNVFKLDGKITRIDNDYLPSYLEISLTLLSINQPLFLMGTITINNYQYYLQAGLPIKVYK
jgi:hypothetical protein